MVSQLIGMVLALMLPLWLPFNLSIWVYMVPVMLALIVWRQSPRRFFQVILILGCVVYTTNWVAVTEASRVPIQLLGQDRFLTVHIQGVTLKASGTQQLQVKVVSVTPEGGETWRPQRLVLQDKTDQVWPLGSVWRLKVRLRPPVGLLNPEGYEPGLMAIGQGVDGSGLIVGTERVWLRQQHNLNSWAASIQARGQARVAHLAKEQVQGSALVSALSLGDRQGLTPDLWALFRVTGLNHLVSISGLHVTLVGGFVAALVQFGLRYWRRPRGHSRLYTGIAGLAAALIYAAISGLSVPTQRSVLMLFVALCLLQMRFYVTIWAVWWAAMVLVLLNHPGAALSIGFWLSFLLVGALLWVNGGRRRLKSVPSRWWQDLLRLQWTATIASIVPVAYFFGEIPVISFLVNLVAIPWTTMVLLPLSLVGNLMPFDAPLIWAIGLAEGSLSLLQRLQPWAWTWSVPALPWPLWVAAGLGTVLWLLPRGLPVQGMLLLCWLLPLAYQPDRPDQGTLRVMVWDVGQGLSILLQTKQQNILYDTGPETNAETVLLNLKALGVRHLDALILSHDHQDHDAGWLAVTQAMKPKRTWAGVPSAYQSAESIDYCAAGGSWRVDDVYFEWLTPEVAQTGNDASCVLRVIAGKQAMLITGDLMAQGEDKLVFDYGDDLFSQVLILGHHGSHSSSTADFLNHVRPKLAVASSGYGNRYGHPHADVVARVAQAGSRLYRTDLSGALRLDLADELIVQQLTAKPKWWRFKPLMTYQGAE